MALALTMVDRWMGQKFAGSSSSCSSLNGVRIRDSLAAVTTVGWYALGAYAVVPKRVQLVGRVQQFDPNDRAGADRITGYTGGVQYFFSGDDLKLQLEYTAFREQGPALSNNRLIVQMQARW